VCGSSSGVCGGAWLGPADRPAGNLADVEEGIIMPKLKGKHAIRDLSYRPQYVKELDEAGIELVDFVPALAKTDPVLISWAEHCRKLDHPCFAARVGHGSSKVSLWVQRLGFLEEKDFRKAPA